MSSNAATGGSKIAHRAGADLRSMPKILPERVRLLLVEDAPTDAELEVRELRRAGLAIEHRLVDSEQGFLRELERFTPHVIISDFSMPHFDGMAALALARELAPDIPFIFVSGTIGEEYAIRALKSGATDYVLKTNLVRLPAAVERALKEARERAAKREAEQARRESETGLRRAQTMAQLAHAVTRPDGSFESWSETLPEIAGFKPDEMPKSMREWLALIHPEEQAHFRATMIEAARRGTRMQLEYRLRRSDGALAHICQVSEPIEGSDAAGRVRWFTTLQDVTALKQAAQALQASEERYRATFEQAAVGIVHTSLDGDLLMVNQTFCQMSGYGRAEAVQRHIRDLTHPEEIERSREGRAKMVEGAAAPYQRELRLVRKDRSHLWVSVTTSLVRDAQGQPAHFVSVIEDISQRRRAEFELRRFRLALDTSADIVVIIDRATMKLVDVNQTACRLLGYTRDELLRMGPADILPVSREELEKSYDELIANPNKPSGMRSYYRCKDGSRLPFESTRRLLRAEDRWIVVAISRDIRERIKTEQALQERQNRIERLNRVHAVLSGINATIVRMRERSELFRETCRIAVSAGGFIVARVVEVGEDGKARIAATAGPGPAVFSEVLEDYNRNPRASGSLLAQALRSGDPVFSNDVLNDERVHDGVKLAREGTFALALLPITVEKRTAGLIVLRSREAGIFDQEEVKLLTELAGDVSFALENIAKTEKLNYLALYDPLTGLANRTLFVERLGQSIQGAGQAGAKFAIAWFDVERLTTINESLGRQVGDAVIRETAERLNRQAGASALARIGGDHFVAVLTQVKGRSQAGRVAAAFARACFTEP